jgi:tripartite-type tricarboxylate transporter receptor subunit TctC
LISNVPFVLAAYPGLGTKTLQDFIAMAKREPQELTFGGSGVGTTGYLVAQLFNQRAGTDLPIVPYPSTCKRRQT